MSASFTGRYRPYVYRDRYEPVITRAPAALATVDLYSPSALSATEIVMAGSDAGRPAFDLWVYDRTREALTNLTATPDVDEGAFCLDRARRRMAFRTSSGQRFVHIATDPGTPSASPTIGARASDFAMRLVPLEQASVPPFEQCLYLDDGTLVGVERGRSSHRLHRCTVPTDGAVVCTPRGALDEVTRFVKLTRPDDATLAVVALRRGDQFRRPFALGPDLGSLAPLPIDPATTGDVLDLHGDVMRVGFESRYRSSLYPESDDVVYAQRRIGGTWFGIVATARSPRTLARSTKAGWELLRHPSVEMPTKVPRADEVWVTSPAGERYQAFRFSGERSDPTRVVVWWHGGPAENVSPRFNPYFHALADRGFTVLAVNYPGSTGRGAPYEARFTRDALVDCVDATWAHLRASGVRQVVSWSVSTGNVLQMTLLEDGRFPISALVDQVGWGRTAIVAKAAERGIPLFTIRGRHDPNTPVERVDHWYPGGHDITTPEDFAALLDAITPFLARVPSVDLATPK